MNKHTHLDELYSRYSKETQPFRQVHRMIDWFESLIKMHTVVILSEYVRYNKFSENAKLLLTQGLFTPTLGIWRRIGQDLFKELEEQETFTWTVPAFREEYQNLLKALEKKDTNVIELRNFYAHGATPEDEVCEQHIRQLEPFLDQLTQLKWLEQSSTIVKNGLVYLESTHGELCLHPVLLFRKENSGSPFAFFNDLKNDKVGLLNYPLSKYWREEDFYEEFQKNLPINDWKRSNREIFEQKIDELTESFKGRKDELENLLTFVKTKRKGYFSIIGNPGIGKSTLIAQFIKELRDQTDLTHLKVIEYFIRRGNSSARPETFLTYLIQKTDDFFKEGKKIKADKTDPWSLQEVLFTKWRAWSSQSQGKKLLFFIDGLDEGTDTDLLTYLPRENFDNILFIYGSRPGGQQSVKDFFHTLPLEHHIRHELGGLKKEDIRSLIYEVGNKYELERESAWIDEVLKRSDGYPLYIKLLCDAIVNGDIALNDVDILPKGIYEQYQRILNRYAKDIQFGNATLQCLYSLAATKDYLNIHQLGRINHLDEISKVQVSGTLMEILSKKENLKDPPSFQLFHESFREYLQKEKKEEVEEAQERIIDFCSGWEELEGSASQHYALQHYASHLKESRKSKRKQELLQLLNNKAFIHSQKQVLRQFDSTKNLLQLGLEEACKQKNWEVQLETALSLVDLKYEEANDVDTIIEMVANGEIDLALHRIESFGGQDEEGLKRKFILYMLCLAELTLLGSREKPFRKSAIEALSNNLDKNIPNEPHMINREKFIPSYLVFLVSFELKKIDINYNIILKRTSNWDLDWIREKGPFNRQQLDLLMEICLEISHIREKLRIFNLLAIESKKAGNEEILRNIIEKIKNIKEIKHKRDQEYKNFILAKILLEIGEIKKTLLISESIEKDIHLKDEIIFSTSIKLFHNKKITESLEIANEIFWNNIKNNLYNKLALNSLSNNKIKETTEIINKIKDKELKIKTIKEILIKLHSSGKKEEFNKYFKDIKKIETTSKGIYIRGYISAQISTIHFFCSQYTESIKKIEEAISKTTQLKTDNEKINLIIIIIKELKEQNKYKEAISLAKEHSLNKLANQILKEATISLAKKGFYVRSLINLRKITHPYEKKEIIDKISNILRLENNKKKAQNIAIRLSKLIPELFPKSKRYILKSNIFLSIGKFNSASKALIKSLKSKEKISLVDEEMHFFYFQNKFKASDAISKYSYIIDKEEDAISKIRALISLSDRLNKIGNIENSIKFAEKALELARSNSFDYLSNLFEEISILYAKNDMIELSLEIIKEFKLERFEKDEIFSQISLHLMSKNKFNDAYRFSKKISTPITRDDITFSIISNQTTLNELNQALKKTKLINDKGKRIQAKAKIAAKFAIQGNKNQSTKLITEIDQSTNELHYITDEILSLVKASKEFEMENQIIVSEYFFSKAMNFINDISNESKKIDILKDVYSEIASLKNIHSVENIFTKTHSIAARQNSFKNLAHKFINDYGIQESLKISDKFNFEESKTHYLKGCVKHVNSNQVDQNTAQKALPYLIHDSESLEIVLQKHALHETFLGNSTQEQLERLNQTLNIQWALDIVATFPKDEENADFSIN